MDYTNSEFEALKAKIEAAGGVQLETDCTFRSYTLTGPVGKEVGDETLLLPGCGNATIFEIPYETESGDMKPIHLCAVCDDLGATPRFLTEVS